MAAEGTGGPGDMAVARTSVRQVADWIETGGRLSTRFTAAGVVCAAAALAAVELSGGTVHAMAALWVLPVSLAAAGNRPILAGATASAAVVISAAARAPEEEIAARGFGLAIVLVAVVAGSAVARELAHRGRTDRATGVLNRSGFLVELHRERERSLRTGAPLSLAYLDLDGLKQANDQHGHAHGDALLTCFASHLDRSRRVIDVAARLGGDEFALLLPGTDATGVEQVLHRLFEALDDDEGAPGASAGAVTWAVPPPVQHMLQEADDAMYRVKREGGRTWVVVDLVDRRPVAEQPTSRAS